MGCNNGCGFGGGSCWWIIIILLLCCCCGGGAKILGRLFAHLKF